MEEVVLFSNFYFLIRNNCVASVVAIKSYNGKIVKILLQIIMTLNNHCFQISQNLFVLAFTASEWQHFRRVDLAILDL